MKSISNITGEFYEENDCVFFRNAMQSAFYVFYNARLEDIFVDDNMKFVFVFSKNDHKRLIQKWNDNKVKVLDNE